MFSKIFTKKSSIVAYFGVKSREELMPSVAVFQAEEGKRSLPKGAHVRFDVETRGIQSKCNFAKHTNYTRTVAPSPLYTCTQCTVLYTVYCTVHLYLLTHPSFYIFCLVISAIEYCTVEGPSAVHCTYSVH